MLAFIKHIPFGRFGTEFLSVFSAVILAFMLNSWNDGRKMELAEEKILKEVLYGLEKKPWMYKPTSADTGRVWRVVRIGWIT